MRKFTTRSKFKHVVFEQFLGERRRWNAQVWDVLIHFRRFRFYEREDIGVGALLARKRALLHKPTQKMVAVKSFRVNLDDDRRKAMITELRTLHESKCPYVVNCYGAFFADGATIRVVLELMDGGSLDCKKNKNLPWKEENIAAVASQASTGLHYLHDVLRVVHRDVKPSNILCCLQTGMVKLSDFGVSGRLGESGAECTSWVGTATYMSPERIRGDGYDYKTDCWSLALTLLEFAFGKFPYAVVASNEKEATTTTKQRRRFAKANVRRELRWFLGYHGFNRPRAFSGERAVRRNAR